MNEHETRPPRWRCALHMALPLGGPAAALLLIGLAA
jgi:hypothetical protein